jgi:RNA polymerase sigma-70 factor, ECF subfamily
MTSAIVRSKSLCGSPGWPKGEGEMSTSSYNPSKHPLPPVGILVEQDPTDERSKIGNCYGLQPLSRVSLRDGDFADGRSKAPDDDLITAAQRGDRQAFVELCGRYSSYTKRKILSIVRNQEDAEDALQDTLLRAYTHLASFRRSCKLSTWLTAIGVNSALMIMRKRTVHGETYQSTSSLDTGTVELQEPVDRSLGPEGIYLKQEAILLVRREIEKLHPSLRAAVNHYYGSEYLLEESAKALDISLSAVKSRLSRGRARLRSSLAKHGISESSK